MNERIQALAIEAEDYADSIVDAGGEFHETYTQKLAELIVRECAKVIMGNEIDHPITGAVYDGDQAKAIKEHFGVKE